MALQAKKRFAPRFLLDYWNLLLEILHELVNLVKHGSAWHVMSHACTAREGLQMRERERVKAHRLESVESAL